MTTEVKLLTEAEALILRDESEEEYIASLKRRGLIAEPVDPLLVEARKQAADYYMDDHEPECAAACLEGRRDDYPLVQVALVALRRGMELGRSDPVRPELTRERVREAIIKADPCCLAKSDFRPTSQHLKGAEAFVDALHAALTDGGRDG